MNQSADDSDFKIQYTGNEPICQCYLKDFLKNYFCPNNQYFGQFFMMSGRGLLTRPVKRAFRFRGIRAAPFRKQRSEGAFHKNCPNH